MTNEEHLIEHALMMLEEGNTRQEYLEDEVMVETAAVSNIELEQVWNMANYVRYSYAPDFVMKKVGDNEYLYEAIMKGEYE